MFMIKKLRKLSRSAKIRYALIVAGILLFLPPLSVIPQLFSGTRFCGSLCMRMFLTLKPTWNVISATFAGVGLTVSVLAVTFFFGRLWCSHFCPIGGASELSSKLVPEKFKLDYTHVSAPSVRYGYFLVFLLAPLFGIGSLCCRLCNFSVVPQALSAPMDGASMAFLFTSLGALSFSFFVLLGPLSLGGRGYCNFMCPVGAMDSLMNLLGSRLGFRRMKVDKSKCTGCGKCRKVCPVWAIASENNVANISQASCISCGKCKDACSWRAIGNA